MTKTENLGSEVKTVDLGISFATKDALREIFSGISVKVLPGEFVSICGLSGVGKSTFVRVLAGLIKPTSGSVYLDGELVTTPPKSMSFVSQDYSRSLFPWLTVSKNVALPFRGKDVEKKEIQNRVENVLAEVGLSNFPDSYPWQLSGGMQQRVAIARALVTRPRLLLLDEPFASVDTHTRFELEDLVLNLVNEINVTTIMVTHDIDEATYMSDRVFVMTGSPAAFTTDVSVDLPKPRSQSVTRSHTDFLSIRYDLYRSMRR
jgi:NitT/TauT family transport system ATP-binding protein